MKRGLIRITKELYEQKYNVVCMIFKVFRPIHIEYRHWENDMYYIYGVSDNFKELPEASMTPEYDVIFTSHDNNSCYTFEFRLYGDVIFSSAKFTLD